MILEFKLPPIGEGVDSADIAEILISPGDAIADEPVVMELETEKAVIELTCPHQGVVQELAVSQGDTITVGQTLFTIDVDQSPDQAGAGTEEDDSAAGAEASVPSEAAMTPSVSAARDEQRPAAEPSTPSEGNEQSAGTSGDAASRGKTPTAGGEFVFVLPNIGEGVESADIAEIHVSVGDKVSKGDPVMELETEKAVVELPCEQSGTVTALHVSVGETVTVGQQLLTLATAGAPLGEMPSKSPPAETSPSAAGEEATRARERQAAAVPAPTVSGATASPPPPAAEAAPLTIARASKPVRAEGNGQAPVPAAPSTRRLARQLGVDLRQVSGSGPGGRITQEDVQNFVRHTLQERLPAVRDRGAAPVLAAGSLAPPPLPDFSRYGQVEREKLSKLGRTAAENLSVSWNVIPHVTQHDRADVTDLEAARKRFSQNAAGGGPKVTMTAIVMKALAACLQEYPRFNSSLDPETSEIVYKRYYHIGCAVDTPAGLLVPVVRDCDRKSIREIAGEVAELAEQARNRKLSIDAMQGATCTVTNLGGIGGTAFTPIINYPEVCILGLARGQKELQLVDGEIRERLMLPLSLSYDHRVINGADAARFMASLCNLLSDPFQLLAAI